MPDREKVAYGLRCMCYGDVECKECPYARNGSGWHDCRSNCAKDALALLKEQEAKQVKTDMYGNFYCPWCSTDRIVEMGAMKLHLGTRYCPYCGKAVKFGG